MRVFLCSYREFFLAIPADYVSSIVLYHGTPETAVDYNSENRNTYISIPLLLNLPHEEIKHGIILKNSAEDIDDTNKIEDRVILLTTAIQREAEITDKEIFSMPKIPAVTQFSMLFNGIIFENENMILFINAINYLQNINPRKNHD